MRGYSKRLDAFAPSATIVRQLGFLEADGTDEHHILVWDRVRLFQRFRFL